MTRRVFAAAVLLTCMPVLAVAEDLPSKGVLTHTVAERMIAACFAAQADAGHARVSVFVVDDGGQLIAAARQDGACKACADIAQNKAITAALYATPTRVFADLSFGVARDGVEAGLPGAAFVPGLVAFAGGLPVSTTAGGVVGAIGVSGASEDEDETCAQAGIDAVADILD